MMEDNTDEGDFFPDPRPRFPDTSDDIQNSIHLNDVSRMSAYPNGTPVSQIFFPRCEDDVVRILKAAHARGKKIGIRGTKHSMGGHSIASQLGWEIDCKYLRQIHYEEKYVRCGPGCQWSDLIKVLNAHGKSPRTMQSYCSFSVGGTLAVNAHGITTDFCFAESVVEFRLARISSKGIAKAIICRPNHGEKNSLSSDLFRLALGGYGLFGVITEVVLKIEDNVQLELDTLQLNVQPSNNVHEEVSSSEFVRVYDNCRKTNMQSNGESFDLGKVELKLARLNTINLEKASLYVFRRSSSSTTISDLPAAARELSPMSRLLYKWAMPVLKDLRYEKEERTGKAIDWSQEDASTRNQLLFESAVPMSKLYNPLVTKDDTFILQEFFCPRDKFSQWIDAVKPIYKEIEMQQKVHNHDLILLNTTIRYVERDDVTFLSYSRVPGGVFAFVLYYRIKRDESTENRLGEFHNRLAKVTTDMGGSFYLPYRNCYSSELLKASYPMIEKFAEMKEKLDPQCLFSNLWMEQYVLPLCTPAYKTKWASVKPKVTPQVSGLHIMIEPSTNILTEQEFLDKLPRKNQSGILRRNNSYRKLLRSKDLRDQFRNQFLVRIFNLADPSEVMRVMARAAWDPANESDIHIYKYIYNHFHGSKRINPTLLTQFWRGIQQLRQQKGELTRQTFSIVSKLGMLGKINNYVCCGDNGKTVLPFVEKLCICGKIWVVHDNVVAVDTLPPIGVVLERGSLDSVAHEEIAYDYTSDIASEKLERIPSGSIDLITMNQGLHHIPLKELYGFLNQVRRMLCPGGLFIIREHDLSISSAVVEKSQSLPVDGKTPYPMLDLAHSIFNAVTGVSVKDEGQEIRAFRPISEWRIILENVGFVDSLVYEVEDGDPTWDEMICFIKPHNGALVKNSPSRESSILSKNKSSLRRGVDPPIIGLINTLLSQVPQFVGSNSSDFLRYIQSWIPKIGDKLTDLILVAIPYLITQNDLFGSNSRTVSKQIADTFEPIIRSFSKRASTFVEGVLALLSASEINSMFNFMNLVHTTELFLIFPYIQMKVNVEGDDASDLEKMFIAFVRTYLPSLLPEDKPPPEKDNDASSDTQSHSQKDPERVDPEEVQEFVEGLAGSLPGILDPNVILLQSGFSITQQASIIGQFGGHDLPSACTQIAGYMDRSTWNELKSNLNIAAGSTVLPTKSNLLDPISGDGTPVYHPWNAVLKTFLKSPKVDLKQQAVFGLRFIGLGQLGTLYQKAKLEYKVEKEDTAIHHGYDSSVVAYLGMMDTVLKEMGNEWTNDIVERKITFIPNDTREVCLTDVAGIIEAWFGYNSITSRKVDITKQMQRLHASIHAKIANPEYKNAPNNFQVGWLPIDEDLLLTMRNGGNITKEVGDTMRKSLVKVATLGAAGHNQLKIKYYRLTCEINVPPSDKNVAAQNNTESVQSALRTGYFNSIQPLAAKVCKTLESKDLVRTDLHPNDGQYTWYKLNEWMQVEMLDELVKSLEHTPWYRFPFMEFLTTYFNVFRQQCSIVQEKYGFLTAYGSTAFAIDLVPGIVMAFLFSQLKLLAIPLLKAKPHGYGVDESRFMEEIVLHLPLNGIETEKNWDTYFKTTLDARILKVIVLPHNFMILSVPTFKAMGEIMEKVALRFPTSRMFQVSNQSEVQVRVSLDVSSIPSSELMTTAFEGHKDDLQKILSVPGVLKKMHYQFPNTHRGNPSDIGSTTSEKMKVYYSLEVHCLALLDVFRVCSSLQYHKVEQVYDFWN